MTAECIQVHGGVGYTWDCDAHLFLRRAKVDDLLLGYQGWQRARVADLYFASLYDRKSRGRDGRVRHDGVMTDPGHRLQWPDVPAHVRADLERALGSAVVEAVDQRGGYGPSLAARCGLADGRRAFIKAVSPAQNPDSPGMMRREATSRRAPAERARARARCTPTTTASGSRSVFEEVDGRLPHTPWDVGRARPGARRDTRVGELVPPHRCTPWPSSTARCSPAGAPRGADARTRRWTTGVAPISTSSRASKRGWEDATRGRPADPRRRAQRQRLAHRRRRRGLRRLDEHVHRRPWFEVARDAAVGRARRRRRARGTCSDRVGLDISARTRSCRSSPRSPATSSSASRLPDPPGLPTVRAVPARRKARSPTRGCAGCGIALTQPASSGGRSPNSQSPFSSGVSE